LIELPALPNKLNFLDCINNKLIELPELPKLKGGLFCSNNNIKYLSTYAFSSENWRRSEEEINDPEFAVVEETNEME
jgi:hypothetical protein